MAEITWKKKHVGNGGKSKQIGGERGMISKGHGKRRYIVHYSSTKRKLVLFFN